MKVFIKICAFMVCLALLNALVGFFLEWPKREMIRQGYFHPQLRWTEFYAQPKNSIDVIFLGSSHCYRSFDPQIFDGRFGGTSFNMGSSEQSPVTSYFVLREALKTQTPKVVVLEVFWTTLGITDQFKNATYNFEFIRSADVRREFLSYGYTVSDRVNFWIPAYRYRKNVTDALGLMMGKPVRPSKEEVYRPRGYVENKKDTKGKAPSERAFETTFEHDRAKNKNIDALYKIIDLAKANDIQLVLVTAPISPSLLQKIAHYDEVSAFIQELAKQNNVPYVDYNLINRRVQVYSDEDFYDAHHLNRSGVLKISNDLAIQLGAMQML